MLFIMAILISGMALLFTWFWTGDYSIDVDNKNDISLFIILFFLVIATLSKISAFIRNKHINAALIKKNKSTKY